MAAKPADINARTEHVLLPDARNARCPLCDCNLEHAFNDGGRRVETLKGPLWVVTNYYRCLNAECDLHASFPAAHDKALSRKKFGLDVWAKVIQHRFKHKMSYELIEEVMWDDWCVILSRGTIRAICEYFEVSGSMSVDEETLRVVKKQGRMVLSLDGAQPKKGRPAFWAFTDRLSGRIVHTAYFEKASAPELVKIYHLIENKYGVKITGVISDKQTNIVNSVREFNGEIPHGYCHFHFLKHIAEIISKKDSHLLTSLRSAVNDFSIMMSAKGEEPAKITLNSTVSHVFLPIVEELKCAMAASGDRFKVFPGLEAYLNLVYINEHLQEYTGYDLPGKYKRSLAVLSSSITNLTTQFGALVEDMVALRADFDRLRTILGKRHWSGAEVKKEVDKWVQMLRSRLRRRGLVDDPGEMKWVELTWKTPREVAWQEWVRLVASHEDGIYVAYDAHELDFTNNPKENLFSRGKHLFRSMLGRDRIDDAWESHADNYTRLMDFEFTVENIMEVLLVTEMAQVEMGVADLRARYATTRRKWRIRDGSTGNFDAFSVNLDALRGTKN